jgi:hypothetical protein
MLVELKGQSGPRNSQHGNCSAAEKVPLKRFKGLAHFLMEFWKMVNVR